MFQLAGGEIPTPHNWDGFPVNDDCFCPTCSPLDISIIKHGDDSIVLIKNVQIVETPQGFVSSFVWFQPMHYAHNLWDGLVYFSFLDFTYKSFLTLSKREMDILGSTAVFHYQITGDQVQRSSQVMDGISDDYRKSLGDSLDLLRFKDVLSCLRVFVGDKFVRMSIEKSRELDIEIRDVLFGPFNL